MLHKCSIPRFRKKMLTGRILLAEQAIFIAKHKTIDKIFSFLLPEKRNDD